jgi:hypothetical protein
MYTQRDSLAVEIAPSHEHHLWDITFCSWNGRALRLGRFTDDDRFHLLSRPLNDLSPRAGFVCGLYGLHRYSLLEADRRMKEWLNRVPTGTCRTFDDLTPEREAVRWMLRPHRVKDSVVIEVDRQELSLSMYRQGIRQMPRRSFLWRAGSSDTPGVLPEEIRPYANNAHAGMPGRVLVCVGAGAGGHACSIAEEIGTKRLLIPDHAAYFRLIGMLVAQWCHDFQHRFEPSTGVDMDSLRRIFMQLTDKATDHASREGFDADDLSLERTIEVSVGEAGDRCVLDCPALSDDRAFLQTLRLPLTGESNDVTSESIRVHGVALHMRLDAALEGLPSSCHLESRSSQSHIRTDDSRYDSTTLTRIQLAAIGHRDGPIVIRDSLMDVLVPRGWHIEHSRAGGVWLYCDDERRA